MIFILSTGADPTKFITDFAKDVMGKHTDSFPIVSLGQGQDKVATA